MAQVEFVRESAALARKSAVIRQLRAQHGPPRFPVLRQSAFSAVARSIVFQQLGAAAAGTIWRRFVAACDDCVNAKRVRCLPAEVARAAGLSGAKWRAIEGLAAAVDSKALTLRSLSRLDDEAVRTRLTQVKGIGPWTANMVLMFHLRRLDVWPTGDYGVRKGYARAWGLGQLPSPRELEAHGEALRPYRSLAAWYCWRAADA